MSGEPTLSQTVLTLRAALDGAALSIFIDPLLANPLAETGVYQTAIASGRVRTFKLYRIHPDIDPARAPYLLHIPDEAVDERLVNQSLETALSEMRGGFGADYRGRSVCGWICGEPDPGATAFRLATIARVFNPSEQVWPLRYWDPRVIWHLPRALGAARWKALSDNLGAWWTFDPQTSALERFGSPAPPVSLVEWENLCFDIEDWRKLERIGTINKVLAISRDWGLPANEQSAASIDNLLARCEAWGYPTEQDKMVFAVCGLTSRTDFDSHPEVAAALREGIAQGVTLQTALARFNDGDWERISQANWPSV
jgi:hypothetical protein